MRKLNELARIRYVRYLPMAILTCFLLSSLIAGTVGENKAFVRSPPALDLSGGNFASLCGDPEPACAAVGLLGIAQPHNDTVIAAMDLTGDTGFFGNGHIVLVSNDSDVNGEGGNRWQSAAGGQSQSDASINGNGGADSISGGPSGMDAQQMIAILGAPAGGSSSAIAVGAPMSTSTSNMQPAALGGSVSEKMPATTSRSSAAPAADPIQEVLPTVVAAESVAVVSDKIISRTASPAATVAAKAQDIASPTLPIASSLPPNFPDKQIPGNSAAVIPTATVASIKARALETVPNVAPLPIEFIPAGNGPDLFNSTDEITQVNLTNPANPSAISEPAALALLLGGLAGFAFSRRHQPTKSPR